MCTVFCCCLLIVLELFDYFFVLFVGCECGCCLKNKTSSTGGLYLWNGTFCLCEFEFCLFLLLVWAIACVLNLDTCCDCSWLCSVFCISALPEFDRSIAVGWESFTCLHPARETPQLNIVLFSFAPSLMLHVLKSKTKCARPVRPAQTKSYDGGDDDLLRLQKSGRPTDGSGHDRLVGWLVSSVVGGTLHCIDT